VSSSVGGADTGSGLIGNTDVSNGTRRVPGAAPVLTPNAGIVGSAVAPPASST
jgi:hypothetical protein